MTFILFYSSKTFSYKFCVMSATMTVMIMIMGHNVRLNRLVRLSVKKESAGLTIWHKWESSYLEVILAILLTMCTNSTGQYSK